MGISVHDLPTHLRDLLRRQAGQDPAQPADDPALQAARLGAVGRCCPRKDTQGMNGTERRYYETVLRPRLLAGELLLVDFQPETFRLADQACSYTPDFRVVRADGMVEFHEVKGSHWEDDARVKIKAAARWHPYRFLSAEWISKRWRITDWSPREVPK